MKLFVLALTLLVCSESITANDTKSHRSFLTFRRHEIYGKNASQLIKKILNFFYNDSSKSLRVNNDDDNDEKIAKKIIEKHLLSRANGTSLLKDFYPGRYSV